MRTSFKIVGAHLLAAAQLMRQQKKQFILISLAMLLQNLIWFGLWQVFFSNVSSLKGWGITEIATFFGIAALAMSFCELLGGGLELAQRIDDGSLDGYLARPVHPLLPLLLREPRPYAFGDMATAFIMWLFIGGYGLGDLPLLILLSLLAAIIILSVIIVVNSLPFYFGTKPSFSGQLLEFFIIISTYPQHGFAPMIKILLFTVVPAGFIVLLPVGIMQNFAWPALAAMLLAAPCYFFAALTFFNRGLRRYTSGNLLNYR